MVTIFIFNGIKLQTSQSLKGEHKLGDMLRAREASAKSPGRHLVADRHITEFTHKHTSVDKSPRLYLWTREA